MRNSNTRGLAKFAVAYSGFVWGLFWLPLRALDAVGVRGVWAVILFQALPGVLLLPVFAARWREAAPARVSLLKLGFATALPMVLYSASLMGTEILRAMVLFYLMPVWSMLLDRLVFGARITPVRLAAIVMALAAMAIMFGAGTGLPLPRNAGDWIAVASGFLWSVSTVLLRADPGHEPLDLTTHYFLCATAVSALLLPFAAAPAPAISTVAGQLWWLIPAVFATAVTAAYASMWGTPQVSPAVSGLLFMTEITAGTVTAALWSGEPFGLRQAAGVALITLAGAMESLTDLWRQRLARRPA